MTRFRTHLMALLGGTALVALSVSGALGAAPWGDPAGGNRGHAVSDFVHELVFGDTEENVDEEPVDEEPNETPAEEPVDEPEETDEDADEESEDADEESEDAEDAEANSHGKCVSEMARSDEVGGANENHGGAVSEAARVTCWETDEEGAVEEPTDEEGAVEDATDEATGEAAAEKWQMKHDRMLDRMAWRDEHRHDSHGRSGDHRGGRGSHDGGRRGDRG